MGQYAINQPPSMLDAPSQVKSLMDQARPSFYQQSVSLSEHGRGTRWADGAAGFGLVNTILPPNSPSVAVEGIEAVDGIYSATSHHQGGTHVLTGDGAVKFITDSIDSGDGSQPTLTQEQIIGEMPESPYGLWGALGTAAAREQMDEEL